MNCFLIEKAVGKESDEVFEELYGEKGEDN